MTCWPFSGSCVLQKGSLNVPTKLMDIEDIMTHFYLPLNHNWIIFHFGLENPKISDSWCTYFPLKRVFIGYWNFACGINLQKKYYIEKKKKLGSPLTTPQNMLYFLLVEFQIKKILNQVNGGRSDQDPSARAEFWP